jgi:protein dithiol:quinone oxidoreductase
MSKGQRLLCGVATVLPLAAVASAVFTQLRLDMQPCPWCILQRLVFLCIALAALPGLMTDRRFLSWVSGVGIFLLALCGMAAALWQHFVAAASQSCAATFADRVVRGAGLDEFWPTMFSATASCSDRAELLGVPYEFYSLALFTVLACLGLWILRRK